MIDFKQMTDDEQTAMAACEEWSNGEHAKVDGIHALLDAVYGFDLSEGQVQV